MAFTDFPTLAKTSPETNRNGANHCHAVLGQDPQVDRKFNALEEAVKRCVCKLGGVNKADLASSTVLGDRWEHYSLGGQIKLLEGMKKLNELVDEQVPNTSMLNEYRKSLIRGKESEFSGNRYSRNIV